MELTRASAIEFQRVDFLACVIVHHDGEILLSVAALHVHAAVDGVGRERSFATGSLCRQWYPLPQPTKKRKIESGPRRRQGRGTWSRKLYAHSVRLLCCVNLRLCARALLINLILLEGKSQLSCSPGVELRFQLCLKLVKLCIDFFLA